MGGISLGKDHTGGGAHSGPPANACTLGSELSRDPYSAIGGLILRCVILLALGHALLPTWAGAQQTPPLLLPQHSAQIGAWSTLAGALAPASGTGSPLPAIGLRSHPITLRLPQAADTARRHKSPALAWFLSWLVPGGGQGHNGQWGKATAFFGAAVVGVALASSHGGFTCNIDCGSRDAGLAVLVASSIGSQIEAPIAASAINRKGRDPAAPANSFRPAPILSSDPVALWPPGNATGPLPRTALMLAAVHF